MVQSFLYHSFSICENKSLSSLWRPGFTRYLHVHYKATGLFCNWKKKTTQNNCSTCKHTQSVPNLYISAMGSSDDAAAWSGLWVINQVGGSSTDLFTLCLLPKQSRSKLNRMYLPTQQAEPPQLRQTCVPTPLLCAPVHTKFPLAYNPALRNVRFVASL